MLKGIHIGGENRLEYLEFLKKKQDENLEKLEKIYYNNIEKEKKVKNEILDESDNQLLNNNINEEQNKKNKNNYNNNNYDIPEEANLIKNDYIEKEKENQN